MQCDVLEDSSKAYGTSNAKPITQIPAEWLVCFQLCLAEHTKFPVSKSLPLMCTPLKRPVERSKAPKPCTRPRSTPSTSTPPANPRTSWNGMRNLQLLKDRCPHWSIINFLKLFDSESWNYPGYWSHIGGIAPVISAAMLPRICFAEIAGNTNHTTKARNEGSRPGCWQHSAQTCSKCNRINSKSGKVIFLRNANWFLVHWAHGQCRNRTNKYREPRKPRNAPLDMSCNDSHVTAAKTRSDKAMELGPWPTRSCMPSSCWLFLTWEPSSSCAKPTRSRHPMETMLPPANSIPLRPSSLIKFVGQSGTPAVAKAFPAPCTKAACPPAWAAWAKRSGKGPSEVSAAPTACPATFATRPAPAMPFAASWADANAREVPAADAAFWNFSLHVPSLISAAAPAARASPATEPDVLLPAILPSTSPATQPATPAVLWIATWEAPSRRAVSTSEEEQNTLASLACLACVVAIWAPLPAACWTSSRTAKLLETSPSNSTSPVFLSKDPVPSFFVVKIRPSVSCTTPPVLWFTSTCEDPSKPSLVCFTPTSSCMTFTPKNRASSSCTSVVHVLRNPVFSCSMVCTSAWPVSKFHFSTPQFYLGRWQRQVLGAFAAGHLLQSGA